MAPTRMRCARCTRSCEEYGRSRGRAGGATSRAWPAWSRRGRASSPSPAPGSEARAGAHARARPRARREHGADQRAARVRLGDAAAEPAAQRDGRRRHARRPQRRRDGVGGDRAAAHEPGQRDRAGGPDHGEQERPGGEHAAEDVAGGDGQRAVEVRARRACRRRGRRAGRARAGPRRAAATTRRGRRARRGRPATARARRAPGRAVRARRGPGRAPRRAATTSGRRRAAAAAGGRPAASTTTAAPGRGSGAKASMIAVATPAAIHPARGSSATRRAAASAAGTGATGGMGVSPASARATSPPAVAGATSRPTAGGSVGNVRSSGSGAIAPPSSSETSGSASASASKRSSSVPRSSGSARTARSTASHSAGGRSRAVVRERRDEAADPARRRARRAGADGMHAGERLVEHDAEGVEVGTARPPRAPRPAPAPCRRACRRCRPCSVSGSSPARCATPKSVSFATPRPRAGDGDDHVLRLDVAVHDAALVRVGERVGEREPGAQHVAVGELAVGLQLGERAALDELGDEVAAVVLLAGVEQPDDAGVIEPRHRPRLPLGALGRRAAGGDHLDGDRPVEAVVVCGVDRAEPAGPDPRAEAVAAEDDARVDHHGRQFLGGGHAAEFHARGRPLHAARKGSGRRRCAVAAAGAEESRPHGECPPRLLISFTRLRILAAGSGDPRRSFLVLLRRGRRAQHPRPPSARGVIGSRRRTARSPHRPPAAGAAVRRLPHHRRPAHLRRALLPAIREGERAQGLQQRGRLDRARVGHAGRPALLRAHARPGQRVRGRPGDHDQRLPRPGRAAVRPGQAARRAGRDGPGPALVPDHHGAAARRARVDRRPRPGGAERRPGGGAAGDQRDRRRDAALPHLGRDPRDAHVSFIRTALADAEVGGQTIQRSQFFPGVQWLDDSTVATALGQQPSTGRRTAARRRPACTARGSTRWRWAT